MQTRLYFWHRRLALLVLVPVAALVLGGLMHPLITHVWVPAISPGPAPLPTLPAAGTVLPPAALLRRQQLASVDQLNLLQIDGRWFWQAVDYGSRNALPAAAEVMPPAVVAMRYFVADVVTDDVAAEQIAVDSPAADSGAESLHDLQRHARALARHWSAAPIAEIAVINHFTREYRSINRVLPVVRVALQDESQQHLYLDLIGQRLIAVDDRRRRLGLQLFARLHNWDFLGARHSPARLLPLLTVVGLVIVVLLLGAAQLLRAWRRRRPLWRHWHARLGLLLLLTTLAFAVSGFETALGQWQPEAHFGWRANTRATADSMAVDPLQYRSENTVALSQAWLAGELFWQLRERNDQGEEWLRYVSASSGRERPLADQEYALQLLSQWLGQPVSVRDISLRSSYGMDYPAIFTRLPVVRVALQSASLQTAFIETHSGHIAHLSTPYSGARAMRFMLLHKYHWLDGLGAARRDLLMSLAAAGVLLLAVSGLLLRRRRRAPT